MLPHHRLAVVAVALCIGGAGACSKKAAPAPVIATRPRGVTDIAVDTAAPAPKPQEPAPVAAAAALQLEPVAGPEKPDAGKRNFSAELERAMSGAGNCLKQRLADNTPSTMSLNLGANVMPSGAVGRGEVSGSGLDAEEVACVRQQLEAVHFAPPIENAPFLVTATVKVTLQNGQAPPPKAATKTEEEKEQTADHGYVPAGAAPTHYDEAKGSVPAEAPGNMGNEAPGYVPPGVPGNIPPEAPPTPP